jgi:BlaI family penicillinase repressor
MVARKKLHELTDLQLAVLAVLWDRGEATANDVHAALEPATKLARGTIGTLLHRLERQRVVTHRVDGREFYYRATATREAVRAARVAGLVGGLFGGDLAAMVSFAVSNEDVDRRDLARLRALIEAHDRRRDA